MTSGAPVSSGLGSARPPKDGLRELIARVVPRRRSRWEPTPVVRLVGDGGGELLTDADAWLSSADPGTRSDPRGVPHALLTPDTAAVDPAALDAGAVDPAALDAGAVNAPAADPKIDPVWKLLDRTAEAWDRPGDGRSLRLRRYELVRLLLRDPPSAAAARHVMRRWLREKLAVVYPWHGPHAGQTSQNSPWWMSLGLWAASRFTPSLRSIREVRWLLQQPYLDGARSDSLDHFVRHLTRESANRPDDVYALLVHALLTDLTAEYRGTAVRRGGRRRRMLPVLLLPDADQGTPAGDLLEAVVRVRRETGDVDPLLVVAQTAGPPTGTSTAGTPTTGAPAAVEDAWQAMEAWRRDRSRAGTVLPAASAVLPLEIWSSPAASVAAPRIPPPMAPPVPWWARRGVAPALVAAALLAGVGSLGSAWQPGLAAGCWSSPVSLPNPFGGSPSAAAHAVDLREGQCIGVSDRTVFGQGVEQNRVVLQQAIYDQNTALDPARPVMSVVYLEQLTGPDDRLITPTQQAIQFGSEVEDLQGLWAAQVRARNLRSGPQLRVIIANAGRGMQHIGDVTDRILELRRQDPSVVAVVGGGESNRATEASVERLSAAGLVFVAPILTTDGFAPGAQNYLQLSRSNADQALLMTRFLAKVGSRSTVTVGYTDVVQDSYVETLSADVVASMKGAGGTSVQVGTGDELPLTDACQPGTTVTYTGRWHLFNDFLGRLDQLPHNACKGVRPLVVGGDSVSSWVTSPFQRTLPAVRVPSIVYASNGVYCDTLDRTGDGEVLLDVLRRREPGLCRRPDAGTARTSTIGERAALAWDAALMLRAAVMDAQRQDGAGSSGTGGSGDPGGMPPAAAIVGRLTQQGYSGAAGRYDFSGRVAQRSLSLVCLPAPDASRVTVWTWEQMTADAPIGRCSAPAAS